ncbi:hypothetical protein K438DRAFT_1817630 [Mycena galopus ATCC 62051]|nr:hypothetical protein K438DRAFT_1817630 [Mycena galopus ATCC 62051]
MPFRHEACLISLTPVCLCSTTARTHYTRWRLFGYCIWPHAGVFGARGAQQFTGSTSRNRPCSAKNVKAVDRQRHSEGTPRP